jgi:hypothetical protein
MKGTIQSLYDRLKKVDMNRIAIGVIKNREQDIISLNQSQLYDKSQKKDGTKLKPLALIEYADFKHSLNPKSVYGEADYKVTGEFFDGFYIVASPDNKSYFITSSNEKTSKLKARDGELIFGLTDESRIKMVKTFFRNEFISEFRKETRL